MHSYDYAQRKGVEAIDWARFASLAAQLVEAAAPFQPEAVVGIARAGLIPAVVVAAALRKDLFPVRLTRRFEDRVVRRHPAWIVDVPAEVKDQHVLVVDEIADTGETLQMVAQRVLTLGARRVTAAVLVSHSWAQPMPEVVALVSDALIIFPWDRQVYTPQGWQLHPEYAAALRLQGKSLPQSGERPGPTERYPEDPR